MFDLVTDSETIKSTFQKFAVTELACREKGSLSEVDVLDDIYQTALCIFTRGADGKGDFAQLQAGIHRISGFIFSEGYPVEKAITHASKAAWLATLMKCDARSVDKYADPRQIKDWKIEAPGNPKMNR